MALCDGERVLPLATAKDYKRIGDGDTGPNTGGMGATARRACSRPRAAAEVLETVLRPTVAGLAAEGRPFVGVLYAGLMLTAEGPRVLEFNARFGDPEAQALLLRLEDDLLPDPRRRRRRAASTTPRLRFRHEAAACVVLASPGYPGRPVDGRAHRAASSAPRALPGVEIFHAGTALDEDGELVSAGGRVLDVCALGADLVERPAPRLRAPSARSTGRARSTAATSAGACSATAVAGRDNVLTRLTPEL